MPKDPSPMPRYIVLAKLTEEGAKTLGQPPDRIAAAIEKWEALGGVMQVYVVMGEYDFVAIGTAPSDYSAMAWGAAMAKTGGLRTVTMKAFDRDDWEWILGATDQELSEVPYPPERPSRKQAEKKRKTQ
jgi:uncharacterized protein with GYD domain